MWIQRIIKLQPFPRGFHLITDEIVSAIPELTEIKAGQLTLLLRHTSASLSLNENADPTVRKDLESVFSRLVPENEHYYEHTLEGPDDLPAHIKSALIGVNLTVPISNGRLMLGTWQGIILGEHRNHATGREVSFCLQGEND